MTGWVPGLVMKGIGRSGWLRPPYYIMVQFRVKPNGRRYFLPTTPDPVPL